MKKIIALVLSAIMLVSVLSVGISAGSIVSPYTFGTRNAIVKFYDTNESKVTPVEIKLVKLPAKFNGDIAVIYTDAETLKGLATMQSTPKFNTLYKAEAAADEKIDYDRYIYVEIPDGYVVYPEVETVVISDTDSWKLSVDVITEEAYAEILAAEAVEEEPVAEEPVAEEPVEDEAAVEETPAEDEDAAEAVVEFDIDTFIAGLQETLGDAFDLSTIIVDIDEDGTISLEELLAAYIALEKLVAAEEISEEVYAIIIAAIEDLIGETFADLIITFVVVEVVEPVEDVPAAA